MLLSASALDRLSAGPLDEFWKLLVEPTRTVIVHAGREETRLCRRLSGQTVNVNGQHEAKKVGAK